MPDDKKDLFIDDEPTSIAVDLTPPPPEKPAKSLADEDEEEESTQVLDWDRAMKKSLEKK